MFSSELFHDQKDEELVLQRVKAYGEEFGPGEVVIHLPNTWLATSGYKENDKLGEAKLVWDTVKQIILEVPRYGVRSLTPLKAGGLNE